MDSGCNFFFLLQVQDSYPFAIGLQSEEGNTISLPNGALYQKGHPFPSFKMLTLHRSNTFHLDVIYANENELPAGVSPNVSRFTVRTTTQLLVSSVQYF